MRETIENLKKTNLVASIFLVLATVTATSSFMKLTVIDSKESTIQLQQAAIADQQRRIDELKSSINTPTPTVSASTQINTPMTTAAISPTTEPIIVLEPIWIQKGRPMQLFSGQILLTLDAAYKNINIATFDMKIPGEQTIHWGTRQTGERERFTYKNVTYVFDILEIAEDTAKISISRLL